MNFADLWEEHKRFIIGLVAAGLVFLIANAVIGAMYFDKADEVEARGNRLKGKLASIPDPATGAINKVGRTKQGFAERLEVARARIELLRDSGFVVEKGSGDADLRYNSVAQRVKDEVVDYAATLDIVIDPTLGLPEFTPASRSEINGYLAALSVVDRVSRLAIEAGVLAVAPIRIVSGTVARFDRGESFVEKIKIEMRVTGYADAVCSLLKGVETAESLIPMGESSLRLNEGGETITADIVLFAAAIHPDQPVERSGGRRRRR